MTEIYLRKKGEEWQRVYFSNSDSGFKLTRENPYFTQSESYTLDVVLPADILTNRQFFQNLQRIDSSKRPPVCDCLLMVNNRPMLEGSAKVTQVTEKEIKVQLLGGNSEVNFLSDNNQDYIDELPIGTRRFLPEGLAFYSDISTGLPYSHSYVHNETTDENVDVLCACHPQLVGVMRLVLAHYGFSMVTCFLDQAPWKSIYIVSALHTLEIAHKLPHWSVRDFVTEFCNFFNVTAIIDHHGKTVEFVSNMDFYGQSAETVKIEPIDEYTSELTEEDSHTSLASSTVAFDLSGSSCHDYDCLTDELREGIPKEEYNSESALRTAFWNMDKDRRRQYLFCAPNTEMASWILSDKNGEKEFEDLVYVDLMKPLDRGTEKKVSLKIVPVAIGHESVYLKNKDNGTHRNFHGIPSLESPTPDETPYPWYGESGEVDLPAIQDLISGAESIEKGEKEDRMQVMFDDGKSFGFTFSPNQMYRLGFIDWKYKGDSETSHSRWSLSLNLTDADHYLGELHRNAYSFDVHSKHTFKFIANEMPNPTHLFIIRGKCYGCEKIEANVKAEGFDRLMTGYFYEML